MPPKKIKLLVVGESGVGKTCLLKRIVDKKYIESEITINVDLRYAVKEVNGVEYQVEFWDTAGCERYQSLTTSYFRNAHGAILVYDITRRNSLDKLEFWLQELHDKSDNPNIAFVVVGNKIDEERVISRAEGEKFARKHGGLFMETSVKGDLFVDDVFNNIIEKIVTSKYFITDNSNKVVIIQSTVNINCNNSTTTDSQNSSQSTYSGSINGSPKCCP